MPTQPPLMLGGLLVVVAGFISPPLAQAAGWLAYPFLAWTTGVVEAAARIPYASVETGDIPGVAVGAYYLVLGALVAYFYAAKATEPERVAGAAAAETARAGRLAGGGRAGRESRPA